MRYLSVPELISEAAQWVPAIKVAGVSATSERLNQLQDKTIVVKYGGKNQKNRWCADGRYTTVVGV